MNSIFLLLAVAGAAMAAPVKVEYVLAPVPLKQSSTDASKLIAIVPLNTTQIVIKFDKPILAGIEKTSEFQANFEETVSDKESFIVKLKAKGELQKPVIVKIQDKTSGDLVKVMIKSEARDDGRGMKE